MSDISMTINRDPCSRDTLVSTRVSELSLVARGPDVLRMALEKIATAIAEEYVKTHLQEILAVIDPQAVANLAVADSAAAIRETVDIGTRQLHKDMRALTDEVSREREVLMPGLFGVRRGVVR